MKKFLIFFMCITFSACSFSSAGAAEKSAKVVSFTGNVKILPAGKVKSVLPEKDMQLEEGARVITSEDSSLILACGEEALNFVTVKSSSDVILKMEEADKVELIDGEVFTLVQKLKSGEEFRVKTPCATCGARGTGWNTKTDGKVTTASVAKGKIIVRGVNKDGSLMKKSFIIKKGFERKINKFEKPGDLMKIPGMGMDRMRGDIKNIKKFTEKKAQPKLKKVEKRQRMLEKRFAKLDSIRESTRESIISAKDTSKLDTVIKDRTDNVASIGDEERYITKP